MKLRYYIVDAFTDRVFGGNPAAVCPLESWLDDSTMQRIAAENNLSETAFFIPEGDRYHLRWFTPTTEVELCGHATLASSYVLWNRLGIEEPQLRFRTLAGELQVSREQDRLVLNFPSRPPTQVEILDELAEALGARPVEMWKARDYVAVFSDEAAVRNLHPNFSLLKAVDMYAVIATAKGSDCDFVSRFFAPGRGIDEDPVTGSAHCELIPFWASRLGKTALHARQISRRGGELFCELKGDRVDIGGNAALYAEGDCRV